MLVYNQANPILTVPCNLLYKLNVSAQKMGKIQSKVWLPGYKYVCGMQQGTGAALMLTTYNIFSAALQREVRVDVYLGVKEAQLPLHLLLLNDGQDLLQLGFEAIFQSLVSAGSLLPLVCVGIHASAERLQEYGIASTPDYAGRGSKAGLYQQFILNELLPFLRELFPGQNFLSVGYAGFSLGGLSAFDTVWSHPQLFNLAGIFSGALWWRSYDLGPGYNDDQHRIMHQLVRAAKCPVGMRFYFTTGSLDETADRNQNGIIDSIDDTLDLIKELKNVGAAASAVCYTNYDDGRHDIATWGRTITPFLLWGWGNK